jgi:hypothetical protein
MEMETWDCPEKMEDDKTIEEIISMMSSICGASWPIEKRRVETTVLAEYKNCLRLLTPLQKS